MDENEKNDSPAVELLKDFIKLSDKEHRRKDAVIFVLAIVILISNLVWVKAYTNKTNSLCEIIKVYHEE